MNSHKFCFPMIDVRFNTIAINYSSAILFKIKYKVPMTSPTELKVIKNSFKLNLKGHLSSIVLEWSEMVQLCVCRQKGQLGIQTLKSSLRARLSSWGCEASPPAIPGVYNALVFLDIGLTLFTIRLKFII